MPNPKKKSARAKKKVSEKQVSEKTKRLRTQIESLLSGEQSEHRRSAPNVKGRSFRALIHKRMQELDSEQKESE